ncbi:hypothetical protein LAZ67_11003397 [Cordylochernes scorpioides]|uniref:PiggyBac transposable element-derived protein domain-containing protein n=1 Tax=Cordylochernes scorpioides TaxID=51811 RepID=A0ABY6KZS8_9ARAC|nr:hypothetical protein LAZ67_11003397 [Cordylochernes scorpioides]
MKNIGLAFVKLGQLTDAVTSFEYQMSERPDFRAALHLVVCHYALGDREKMKRGFLKLLDVSRDHLDDEEKYMLPNNPLHFLRTLKFILCLLSLKKVLKTLLKMNFLMKKWMKTSQVLGKLAWKDTTLDEMMAFIGVIFNMGNVKKNQIRDYWSKNELLETPWFGKVMSRGRFELLYSCFSLIDDSNLVPSSHPDYNPTARFEKLIEHVNNKFIYYYKPTQNLTVDESLVCLKKRTRLRQYMPQKHHGRFGVKLWMLCESKTGYCLRMKPYKGKLSPIIKSLSYDVPMNLLQESSLLGKGYHLITDNFFTSINLAKDLLDSHTYLTGTIRTNRKGLPKTLKSAKLGVDESLYMVNNNLLALAYKEKKSKPPVKFLSTFCDASSGKKKVSDQRDYPQMKICYDSYMGGVDLNDQMLYTYMDERKGRKFYRKVILNIFHRAFLNSFILYEQHTKDNPKLSRRAFNYSVINELVKNHLKPPVLPSTSQEVLEKLPEKREISGCVQYGGGGQTTSDNSRVQARPMTAVRGAGYSSLGTRGGNRTAMFDPHQNRPIASPLTASRDESSAEEKLKVLEKLVGNLMEESCFAAERREFKLVLFNLAIQYTANEMYTEAINTYQQIVKNRSFTHTVHVVQAMIIMCYWNENFKTNCLPKASQRCSLGKMTNGLYPFNLCSQESPLELVLGTSRLDS